MKVLLVKKSTLIYTVLVVALSVALLVSVIRLLPRGVAALSAPRELPIYSVDRTDKIASLSFDAAWGNEDTQTLIDILNKYQVHATFFVVGQWVDKYPESVKALADAGNEVMNHSDTHPHLTKLSAAEITAQAEACNTKIEKITGKKPTLLRPPYGDYNNTVIQTLRGIGMEPIQWSIDSLDWKGISATEIQQRVIPKIQPGSIILFHNAAEHTPEALPGIIESLQKDGYKLVPVSQLVYQKPYTIDTQGRQHQQQDASSGASLSSGTSSGAASIPGSKASSGAASTSGSKTSSGAASASGSKASSGTTSSGSAASGKK